MAIGGSGDYLTKLKENLSCPVCYEVFNSKERIPKGLPCYHSMCLSCLAGFVKKNLRENYLCPLCQAKFTVPAGGVSSLPTNTGLTGMLDLLPPQEESTPVEERAVEIRLKVAKHDCHIHDSVGCSMYCKTCHVPLCIKCITSDKTHHGHDLEEIDITISKMKDTLSNAMTAFENLVKDHESKVEETNCKINQQIEKSLEKVALEISEEAETLIEKSKNTIREKSSEILKPLHDGILKFNIENETIARLIDNLKCMDLDLGKQHYKQIEDVASKIDQLKKLSNATNSADLLLKLEVQIKICSGLSGSRLSKNEPLEKAAQTSEEDMCIKLCELGNVGSNTVNMYMMINHVKEFLNSKLNTKRSSQDWYVKGAQWKIKAQMQEPDGPISEDPIMWAGVTCDGRGKKWKYTATQSMQLYNYDIKCFETPANVDKQTCTFDADSTAWGWDLQLLTKKSLLQPVNKYVKNNTVMFLVKLTVH